MKDEIKEILDKAKENYKISEFWTPEFAIDILKDRVKIHTEIGLQRDVEQDIVLLDYITNLQEENERLANELNQNMIERNNYLSRNEKAIEYFKYQLEQLDFYEDTKAKMLCAMGIVILQGENKDE